MNPVYVGRKAMWLLLQSWNPAAREGFPVKQVHKGGGN